MLSAAFLGSIQCGPSRSSKIIVAVAGNFAPAAKEIAKHYEQESGKKVSLVFGSTGKLYTQISKGAPYHIFLAADAKHPLLLEKEGRAIGGTRFTYAIGRIVLWSAKPELIRSGSKVLFSKAYRRLAIANPRFAPYGLAAKEVLMKLSLWNQVQEKLVMGENIMQTYYFVKSQNADLGFVSASLLRAEQQGSRWEVPANMHSKIEQQAILLKDTARARSFLRFMRAATAKKIIRQFGYGNAE